ncbi:MAG: hypothetical protein GKR94_34270 [Gammaproteobacteria bacterium]|nr:hypothetical protein [Gammaproteobacteria bacterium]
MELESTIQVFGVGFAGGLLLEVIHWYGLTRDPNFSAYKRSAIYWLMSVGMAGAGGLLAMLYFGDQADGLLALHVGISAPLILQKMATTAAISGGKSTQASIINFFHW